MLYTTSMNTKALRSGATMAIVRTFIIAMAAITLNLVLLSTSTAQLPREAGEGLHKYKNAQEFFKRLERDDKGNIIVAGQQGEDIALLCLTNAGKFYQDGKLKPSQSALALIAENNGARVFFRGLLRDDKTGRVLDARYSASKEDISKGVRRDDLIRFLKSKGISVRDTP